MTAKELTAIINLAYEAVGRSVVGPIYTGGTDASGHREMNSLAYQAFVAVISQMVPRSGSFIQTAQVTADETKEDWQN